MIIPTPNTYRPILEDFRKASKRIEGIAFRTPLLPLRWYNENLHILLKPEMLQPIGCYKIRGVLNWVKKLNPEQRAKGISTASSGNMAQAVAYVAKIFNIPARAIVIDYSPQTKRDAITKYGAELVSKEWDDWIEYTINPDEDRCFIHPLEAYGLLDGHGTIGLEIIEDAPETETIFVPLGSGLLGAGVSLAAKALKPSVRVVGVNTDTSPHYFESLKLGKVANTPPKSTLADGTAVNLYSFPNADKNLKLINETIDEVVLVSEEKIKDTIRYLSKENNLVCEASSAMSLAAAMNTPLDERGKTVCILTGGNIDSEKLKKIL